MQKVNNPKVARLEIKKKRCEKYFEKLKEDDDSIDEDSWAESGYGY